MNRAPDKLEFIQARHEEMAAFMASAYAKFTGELGVCIATSGPGASHLITGMYDARMDHVPILAIAGRQATTAPQGRHWSARAVRGAKAERRATALVIPNARQDEPYEPPARKHGT